MPLSRCSSTKVLAKIAFSTINLPLQGHQSSFFYVYRLATERGTIMVDTTLDTGPAIHITNAGAGTATFSGSDSRSFNYFKPKGRQASVYEDVTLDVQPDPERY